LQAWRRKYRVCPQDYQKLREAAERAGINSRPLSANAFFRFQEKTFP
jgi:hypothetical protein